MSGADYVYLVLGQEGEPLAVFDVKYGLRGWLGEYKHDLTLLQGYRMRCGIWHSTPPVTLDLEAIRDGRA